MIKTPQGSICVQIQLSCPISDQRSRKAHVKFDKQVVTYFAFKMKTGYPSVLCNMCMAWPNLDILTWKKAN